MSSLMKKWALNRNGFIIALNKENPIWFMNHLSDEDKKFFCGHIKDILEETDKIGTQYMVAFNAPINGMSLPQDIVDSPFSPVRGITRAIEISKNIKVDKFNGIMNKSKSLIPIASDYVKMIDVFNSSLSKNTLGLKILTSSIRSLAMYEFNSLRDVLGIIDGAGLIGDNLEDLTLYEIIDSIETTIDMLFSYLRFIGISYEGIDVVSTRENTFEYIKRCLNNITDLDAYLSYDLSNKDELMYLYTMIQNILSLYIICCGQVNKDKIFIKAEIKAGYLYRRIIGRYPSSNKDEINKILDDLLEIAFPPIVKSDAETNKLNDLKEFYDKEINKCYHIISSDDVDKPEYTKNSLSDRLSMKEISEIDSILKIKRADIASAIYNKIGMREGSIIVKRFLDISEDLLAMYLAEFNSEKPLLIFDPFDRYMIKWEDHYYLLFELSCGGSELNLSNCLYAIRITDNSDENEKLYELIQFKVSNSVKYVFEY